MSGGDQEIFASRRERVRSELVGTLADGGGALFTGVNCYYLTGFRGEGLLLLTQAGCWLVVNPLYASQAQAEAKGVEVVSGKKDEEALAKLAGELRLTRLGFAPEGLSYQEYVDKKRALAEVGCALQSEPRLGDRIRLVKEEGEIRLLEQAAALLDQAFWACLLPGLREGRTEWEVARELEIHLLAHGAEALAFPTILLSGPRGGYPHGIPGEKRLAAGELVTIDFGVMQAGYASDMTRTVAIGEPGARAREIYQLVQEAQAAALMALRPGVRAREVDAVAREIITAGGYGEAFVHGLGHGVGLKVHEEPRLNPKEDLELQPGMVVTVEPGLYLADWGGVRIEDTVVITETGARPLTHSPKELLCL